MRSLHAGRYTDEPVDDIVVTLERDWLATEECLHNVDRFGEPTDANTGRVVVQTGSVVVAAHPPGAEPKFDASFAEHVERRGHAMHEHGMAVVDAEHCRLHSQI